MRKLYQDASDGRRDPGAIVTVVTDEDGKPDIIALMAQGNEGIFIII